VPCDIGYRSVARATIERRQPETIDRRASAPPIDRELLDRLGQDDPAFVDWITTLDVDPLLGRALGRARDALAPVGFAIRVDGGALAMTGPATAGSAMATFAKRWQLEVLRVICELLDFDVAIVERGGRLVIEGEKHGTGGVHEYVSIAADAGDGVEVRFEHFVSDDALAIEQRRFLALAHRLGVKLQLRDERRAGQPIPPGTIHPHKGRGKA
jgi:hypothetical protein